MTISTTITKKFFDMKMEDLKQDGCFFEYKEVKPFWTKRFNNLTKPEIVFLVGNKPFRFRIVSVQYIKATDVPDKYAGAIKTEYAYMFHCIELVQPIMEEVASGIPGAVSGAVCVFNG